MTLPNPNNGSASDSLPSQTAYAKEREVLQEDLFKRMIAVERKRTERSAKPFLLMLLETGEHQSEEKNGIVLAKVIAALSTATRDRCHWLVQESFVRGSDVYSSRHS